MYAIFQCYFTLKILRSSPRRHRGERTTTIPMKTPPLPVGFTDDGCSILCADWKSVPCKMIEMCYTEVKQKTEEGYHMTDQELLQAIREITREEIQASEKRVMTAAREEIQASEKRVLTTAKEEIQASEKRVMLAAKEEIQASEKRVMLAAKEEIQASEKRVLTAAKEEIQASESRIKKETIILMDAEFGPKFNLLAENQAIMLERLDRLERKVDGLEDKVLEHDFRLKIIK